MNRRQNAFMDLLKLLYMLSFVVGYLWIYYQGSLFGFTKEQIAVFCFDLSFILVVLSIILMLIAIIAIHITSWYRLRKLKK